MSKRRALSVVVAVTAQALPLSAVFASGGEQTYVAVTAQADGSLRVDRVRAPTSAEARQEVALQTDAEVLALTRDGRVESLEVPGAGLGDLLRPAQWALDRLSFEASWSMTIGAGAVVAVVDSGVQADHEDLRGSVLPGWDVLDNRPGATTDASGHGTHVAGILAAVAGNGRGIAGGAPGARILPVRVLDADGSGAMSDVAKGIVWAVDHGADVINLSLGGTSGGSIYRSVLEYARDRGVVVVAAAGNEALKGNATFYPAADPEVLAVSSVTPAETRAPSSNWGPYIDLAAPGAGILGPCPANATVCRSNRALSLPPGYAVFSGTSMATPFVAAAAALLVDAHPQLEPADVSRLLQSTAEDLGRPGWDQEYGAGLLDPRAALERAEAEQPAPDSPPAGSPPAPGSGGTSASAPGYWIVGRQGRVDAFGSAPVLGDLQGRSAAAPVVAAAATGSGGGYWLATADGGVFAFGDAGSYGSLAGVRLNAPVVGMAATTTGQGYWLLGADGGIFSFGDAVFYGSTGAIPLNAPIVDLAPTPTGRGYWLLGADGGVFSFGDAVFSGSTGGLKLNRPVVSLASSPGGGYWLVAEDGGIFSFGVPFHGSLPGLGPAGDHRGLRIRAVAGGAGYYILGPDGGIFAFGAARFHGSAAGTAAADLLLLPQ
jgi:type VII secretion-associated serine protease mycosin